MKYWRAITISLSALLLWGWLLTPITGVASTADSPATIRFDGATESSNHRTSDERPHVTEESKASRSVSPKSSNHQPKHQQAFGWLPQTDEQWWLNAFIVGIGILVILISWQLLTYLKKRSSLL